MVCADSDPADQLKGQDDQREELMLDKQDNMIIRTWRCVMNFQGAFYILGIMAILGSGTTASALRKTSMWKIHVPCSSGTNIPYQPKFLPEFTSADGRTMYIDYSDCSNRSKRHYVWNQQKFTLELEDDGTSVSTISSVPWIGGTMNLGNWRQISETTCLLRTDVQRVWLPQLWPSRRSILVNCIRETLAKRILCNL